MSAFRFSKTQLLAISLLIPALAQAHPGHGLGGLGDGLAHPFMGWDHLLAMIASGTWAAQLGGRARFAVPAVFVAASLLGLAAAVGGTSVAGMEMMIALSVLVLGGLILRATRLPLAVALATVAGFAFFHGAAHGAEMPQAVSAASFGAGFVVATLTLHVVGLAVGIMAEKTGARRVCQAFGALVLAAGAAMSVGIL